MLEVKNLHASIAGKEILKGINLTVKDGEIHAIMGPNGSGKSTLSAVLTGNPLYTVTEGTALFNGKDFLAMKPEDRAREGLFLSFQYPVEIPGVMLDPKLSILDETDSGLDVDAMRIVAEGVNKLFTPEKSIIVITHYERLLDMIKPQVVHVLYNGRIVRTEGPELAKEIEKRGYDWIKEEADEKYGKN